MNNFEKNSTLLVTGGTGSFGKSLVKNVLNSNLGEIRIFSRDEEKQDKMRSEFNNPKLKFIIGDIRDFDSVDLATKGVDYIFHAAALKQVPSCEFFPMEAIKTNVLGINNLIESSVRHQVKKLIALSTDKSVYPINVMGLTKALMEIFGKKNYPVKIIGSRHGEKKHETLMSREEKLNSQENKKYFVLSPDLRDLNYEKYFSKGQKKIATLADYTSDNTSQLDVKSLVKKISKILN